MRTRIKVLSGAILLLATQIKLKAQEFRGIQHSNYFGLGSAQNNPASIAGHMYKWDFILAGASLNIDNDFVYWNKNNTRYKFNNDQLVYNPSLNSTYLNYDHSIQGPSFMYSFNNGAAAAIGLRQRNHISVHNVSRTISSTLYSIKNNVDTTLNGTTETAGIHGNTYKEIYLTLAKQLKTTGALSQKIGITPKLLIGSSQVQGDFSQIEYLYNRTSASYNYGIGSIHYSNNLDSATLNVRRDLLGSNGYGFGVDIGYQIIYNPNGASCGFKKALKTDVCSGPQYIYRLGVSLTDLGFIRYNNGQYAANMTYNNAESVDFVDMINGIENQQQAYDSLNTITTLTSNTGKYAVSLPTRINLDFDYRVTQTLYINTQGSASLSQIFNQNGTSIPAQLTISPRFEKNLFGVYAPLSINQYGNFDPGVAFRAGPLILGINDINSFFTKNQSNDIGAYIMFKSFFGCKKQNSKVKCPRV
ncbi:MAG: hypothetical protein JXQ87_01960 [Bacteroidia bacterium]